MSLSNYINSQLKIHNSKLKMFNTKNFRFWSILTVLSIYLLILVGGIVRSTGAGMGCPDWPKCFGQWIPPTQASEIPANYKDFYANARKQKNVKIASYLDKIGFSELALRIVNDESIYIEQDFNATKTWIEYLNRLLGALIGVFVFASLLTSIAYFKTDKLITLLAFSSFILVGIQGWIGSVVVSTNLLPGIISVHMFLAILIVFLLIYAVARATANQQITTPLAVASPSLGSRGVFGSYIEKLSNKNTLNLVLISAMVMLFVQTFLGTQVRETVDIVAKQLGEGKRDSWIEQMGLTFYVHRSFSLLIFGVHIYLIYLLKKNQINKQENNQIPRKKGFFNVSGNVLIGLIAFEIASGAAMAYLAIPAFLQPLHLVVAVLILGVQFFALLFVNETYFFKQKQAFVGQVR